MRRAFALSVGLLTVTASTVASAYCRTSACGGKTVGAICTPPQTSDCGFPLYWPTPCIGITVQEDGSSDVTAEATRGIVNRAIDTWMAADCGGGAHPRISIVDQGFVACHEQEYNQDKANSNTLMFRDDDWPYAKNRLAITTVTYNLDTGEIRDADMEFNSAEADFTTTEDAVDVDLESVVTHEMGHFLGLAHSPSSTATMFADYPPGSVNLRTLEADDVAGLCATYPPGVIIDCDPTPRGGLGDECGSPALEDAGCGCRVASTSSSLPLSVLVIGGVLALARRRAERADA